MFDQPVAGSFNYYCCNGSSLPVLLQLKVPNRSLARREHVATVFFYGLKDKTWLDGPLHLPNSSYESPLATSGRHHERRWGGLFRAPVVIIIGVSIFLPSLIAIVLSQRNKSKYFFPLLVSVTYLFALEPLPGSSTARCSSCPLRLLHGCSAGVWDEKLRSGGRKKGEYGKMEPLQT